MSRLVEVGRYDNALFAYRLVDVLADAGIEAEVMDENAGSWLPHIGAIGVRVVVAEEDAERAREAIEADRRAAPATGDAMPTEEEEACERVRGPGDVRPDAPGAELEPPPAAAEIADAERWARKTRDIAFVGIGVVLLALVALYRVLGPPRAVRASPRARRDLRQATVLSVLGVVAWTALVVVVSMHIR